ncbi:MAG: TolC family protein [Muribaculaceae bacterium]|nr:TolC family protein [Muribaculaceae bacterium]
MRFIILSLFTLLTLTLNAQFVSPEKIAREIAAASPRLKSAIAAAEVERAKSITEGNLPDPEIEGEFLVAPAGEQNRWGAGISWGLEWPGVYAARKNVNSHVAAALDWKARSEEREVNIQIRQFLLDYILQTKEITVVRSILDTTDSIFILTSKALKGGETTLLDLNKLSVEKISLESRIAALSDQRDEIVSSISSLAGKDMKSRMDSIENEFPNLILPSENDLKTLSANLPAIKQAEAELESARSNRKLVSRESLPGISFGYRHAFEDGNHFNGATLGLTIPLFSNKGKKSAAAAGVKAAEMELEYQKSMSETDIVSSLRRISMLQNEINKISSVIEKTDNQSLLLKAYNEKIITLIDFLNERNYFLEATLSLLELRHRAASALLPLLHY